MNRYPLWKYLIIAIALIIAVLYSVPNLFGEVPALQVSPVRATLKADAALQTRVTEALAKADIPSTGVALEAGSVRLRFADTDLQLRAKDAVEKAVGDGYIVALNLVSNSPRWLTAINALPMYLGLDLRGGVHFMLQIDTRAALTKRIEGYVNDVRTALREQKIVSAGISREGQAVTVRFRDSASREKAMALIAKNSPDLSLRTVDEGEEFRLVATLSPEAQRRSQEFALQQNVTTLRNRVNELGVAEPVILQQGADRIVVQLPGVQDTAKAKEILGRTAALEIRMVAEDLMDPSNLQAGANGQPPFGTEYYVERNGGGLLVRRSAVLSGDRITDAQPGFDGQTSEPAVHLTLDGAGARIFQQVTRENVNKRMAILLIEKGSAEVVTAPVIRSEIAGGRVQISGRMTTAEARDTALLLRAGALAAPMEIIEERTIGPSLGAENISRGFYSTLYGFLAIAIFMIAYYGAFGVISVIALAANLLLLVAILSMLQATLTLPGIAAIALTLGMAIDANVLINERVREELRNGVTPQQAINLGYERAFNTIIDSNVTTLIAGLALLTFGSGPVRGFAVVHCLGILTSIFSAVFVSRGMVNLLYGSRRKLTQLSI
ncbi:MAG: protein translocase subunit SecD, partial [Proteobacteria bacterium]|nr:protein translocase subunit SecD [Burkholderiales bacterium]